MFLILAEFINLISSESNEVCNREEKRTIAPEHVLKALEVSDRTIIFFYPRVLLMKFFGLTNLFFIVIYKIFPFWESFYGNNMGGLMF